MTAPVLVATKFFTFYLFILIQRLFQSARNIFRPKCQISIRTYGLRQDFSKCGTFEEIEENLRNDSCC